MSESREVGEEEQFNKRDWLNYLERIKEIEEGQDPLKEAIAEIFKNIPRIPPDQINQISSPLRRMIEEIVKKLEVGE